ncbi:hypothetical protein [Parabacteroides sp.]
MQKRRTWEEKPPPSAEKDCPTRVGQLFDTRQTAVSPWSNSCLTEVGQSFPRHWG